MMSVIMNISQPNCRILTYLKRITPILYYVRIIVWKLPLVLSVILFGLFFFSLFKIILQFIDNIVQPKQCAFFIILSNDIWWMCRKCDPHSISTIIRSTLNVYIPSKWVMQKNNIPTAWPIINIDTLCLDFEPHIHFVLPDMQLY